MHPPNPTAKFAKRLTVPGLLQIMGVMSYVEGHRTELRKSPRRNVVVRCRLQDGAVDRYAQLADISEGGARVVTAGPPPLGSRLNLSFKLDNNQAISALARVVWRSEGFHGRGGLMGVQFETVSAPHELAAFVGS